MVEPRIASFDEVCTFHSKEYVSAVWNFSRGRDLPKAPAYNFSVIGDNPVYPGMYEVGLWSTGASLKAVELLLNNNCDVAVNFSGGLHHAMPSQTSGFCVFNDPVISILKCVGQGLRVAYVDIDCHHGDGVEAAFVDSDQVLTISLHESGEFLFPGSGDYHDFGYGTGRGYVVNLPLHPDTDDEVYEWAFLQVVPPLVQAFRPDVLVTQIGIDTHFRDPITHLNLTVQGYTRLVRELSLLSPGRWLVLGGGGYDLQAVIQGWTAAFGIILGYSWPDKIPEAFYQQCGVKRLYDPIPTKIPYERKNQAFLYAQRGVNFIRDNTFPIHNIKAVKGG